MPARDPAFESTATQSGPRTTIETTIAALAPGGEGMAHVVIAGERRAVFAPHTAPGDVARLDVDLSRRPARGRLLELLAPGPARIESACAWSLRCGGCDWMHLSAQAQTDWHADHVRAALPREWHDVPISTQPALESLGHRTRARLHVRCERGRVVVGMHEARTHDPVEVDACVVLDPTLEIARRSLATWLGGSRGRGEAQIALGLARRPVLDLHWRGELAAACFGRIERACEKGELAGARLGLQDATRPAVVGDPTPWTTGADGEPLRLAAGGFAQASESMNVLLARRVAELVGAKHPERVVELHAGAGNLSVLLARETGQLVLVESNRDACSAARSNLAARGLSARVVEGDAETYAWSPATKLLVLDPPRAGARAVVERLCASRIAQVVYVSCDAATLGRDLGVLAHAYELRSVNTFEMFPHNSHVEIVVALERRRI